jgi:hypothetical protein
MMSVEQLVEWELAAENEVLRENLPQYHFVHHKSYMTWAGLEAGDSPPDLWHGLRKKLTESHISVISWSGMR